MGISVYFVFVCIRFGSEEVWGVFILFLGIGIDCLYVFFRVVNLKVLLCGLFFFFIFLFLMFKMLLLGFFFVVFFGLLVRN